MAEGENRTSYVRTQILSVEKGREGKELHTSLEFEKSNK